MPSSSVGSNGTLTPVENLDHHEDLPLATGKQRTNSLDLNENNSMPITMHKERTDVLQDIEISDSGGTRIEVKTPHSHDTRTINVNVSKISSEKGSLSTNRTKRLKSNLADNFHENDSEEKDEAYRDQDSENEIENDNKTARHENAGENFNGNSDEAVHADAEGGAVTRTALKENEIEDQNSYHIFDDFPDKSDDNEKITDLNGYIRKSEDNQKEVSGKEGVLASDQHSDSLRRVSVTSDKVEPDRRRRSSVYYETQVTPASSLLEAPSREKVVEAFAQVTEDESSLQSLKEKGKTSLIFSFDNENDGKNPGNNNGNKEMSDDAGATEDDDDIHALGDPLEVFYLDMLKNGVTSDNPATEDTLFETFSDDLKNGDRNSKNRHSDVDSNSETGVSDNKSTTSTNSGGDKQDIQKHELANNELVESQLKQTKMIGTFGVNYEDDNGSVDSKSTSPTDHLHRHTGTPLKHEYIHMVAKQNGSNNDERRVEQKNHMAIMMGTEVIENSGFSNEEQDKEGPVIYRSDNSTENDKDNLALSRFTDQDVQMNINKNLKAFPGNNAQKKKEIDEEINENISLLLNLRTQKVRTAEGNNSSNNKNRSGNSVTKSPKQVSDTLSKLSPNKHPSYQSIVEMKAIDRLLTGPYSESLIQKTPSPRRGTYKNPTKASVNKIKKHRLFSKVKYTDKENENSKTSTSTKSSDTNSLRNIQVSNSQSSSAKSEERKLTTKTDKSTTKTDKSTTKTDKSTTKNDKSATQTDKSTAKTDKSTTKNDKSTTQTDKSTAKTDKSTTKTDKSTTKADKSTIKTDKSAIKADTTNGENKPALDKAKKSTVQALKHKFDKPDSETSISTKEPSLHSEEDDRPFALTSAFDKHYVPTETFISVSGEQKHTETATNETVFYEDDGNEMEAARTQKENITVPGVNAKAETQQHENISQNSQKEIVSTSVTHSNANAEKRREPDNQNQKKDKHVLKKKPSTLREWFQSKKKMKESSEKTMKKQGTKIRAGQKNKMDKSLNINSIVITTTQDTHDTLESAPRKTKEPPELKDPPATLPASIIIVDETSATESQTDALVSNMIINDILHKYKMENMTDSTNSTTPLLINGSPGSPPPESILGNGVSKFYDRSAPKTVSINSLTVPGLVPNPFSGDTPLDEDAISIYSRRDSSRQSFDSVSRKSVDYRIRNTALVVLPNVDEKPKSVFTNEESFIKNAIPFLPVNLAVICLILNIILPGSGTALSGLSILFCGQPRVSNKDDQILITLCANCMVGLAQLFTVTFLLVGWFWSIGWGIEMVMLSVQHEKEMKEQRSKELQSLALSAFGSPEKPTMFGT